MIAGEAAGKTAAMPRAPMVKQKEMNVPLKIYAPSMAWVDDGGPVGNAMMLLEFQIMALYVLVTVYQKVAK